MNYAEAEEYINQIPRFSKVKSEENVDEILALFGQKEKVRLYPCGREPMKRICLHFDSMLPDGRKEDRALYVTTHLITTTERMKINGQNISEEAFTEIF